MAHPKTLAAERRDLSEMRESIDSNVLPADCSFVTAWYLSTNHTGHAKYTSALSRTWISNPLVTNTAAVVTEQPDWIAVEKSPPTCINCTAPSSLASSMDPTRVLVTGGCGFIGTAIVSALLSTKRYAITAIDINPPSLGSATFTNSVRYVRCDILDPSSLRSVFSEAQPAIVVHTVGAYLLGTMRYSQKGKDAIFKVNVDGTRNVIEASTACGAKGLVYTSSVTVVLDKLDQDFRNVDERWPPGDVDTSYGRSKVNYVMSQFCGVLVSRENTHTHTHR